jgi:hypothetical protein
MMPDPSRYAELLEESFAELEGAPVTARKKRKRKTAAKKTAKKKKKTTAGKTSNTGPVAKSASATGSESPQLKQGLS